MRRSSEMCSLKATDAFNIFAENFLAKATEDMRIVCTNASVACVDLFTVFLPLPLFGEWKGYCVTRRPSVTLCVCVSVTLDSAANVICCIQCSLVKGWNR